MDILFSDVHSPLTLSLNVLKKSTLNQHNVLKDQNQNILTSDVPYTPIKTKLIPERKVDYLRYFNIDNINNLYAELQEIAENNYEDTTQVVADEKIGNLENILLQPSFDCGFSKNISSGNRLHNNKNNKNKPWFDINCKNRRNDLFRIKNTLKKSKASN